MTGRPISATWVWSRVRAPELVDFARAAGLREVYVSVPWQIDPTAHLTLRATCHSLTNAGIGVAALGGDPEWPDRPDDTGVWVRRALTAAPFTRVHLDIEPWAHRDWDTARSRLVGGYLEALRSARAAAGSTPVDVDVAHFLWDVPRCGGTVLDAVAALADRLVVMAYARTAADVADLAQPTVLRAGRLGKRCSVGVQAGPDGFDTSADLSAVANLIAEQFAGQPNFGGVVVHDQRSWQVLP